MSEFARLQLGPVVMRDQIDYFRECRLLDEITVTLALAGLSEDASRMILRNEFFRGDILCARVNSTAGWFDLRQRKLVVPPPELAALLRTLSRSEDFAELPGSAR
jgi:acyl-CoA thioester hydrolase